MSTNIFQTKKITDIFDDEITYGAKSYDTISYDGKKKLKIAILEILGSDAFDRVALCDVVTHLTQYLKTSDTLHALDLADNLGDELLWEHGDKLEEVFKNLIADRHIYALKEAGYIAHVDRNNGETIWIRRGY